MGIVFIILIIILYIYYRCFSVDNYIEVPASNGEYYKVHAKSEDKKKAAETMARLHSTTMRFFKYLISIGEDKRPLFRRLLHRYNYQNLVQNYHDNMEGSTSYVEGKGRVFAMCLKADSFNTLMFVKLHELSHLTTTTHGHGVDFWENFRLVLKHAVDAGIYRPVDYGRNPVDYCGISVDTNPLF